MGCLQVLFEVTYRPQGNITAYTCSALGSELPDFFRCPVPSTTGSVQPILGQSQTLRHRFLSRMTSVSLGTSKYSHKVNGLFRTWTRSHGLEIYASSVTPVLSRSHPAPITVTPMVVLIRSWNDRDVTSGSRRPARI